MFKRVKYWGCLIACCFVLIACSESQPKLSPLHQDDVVVAFGDSLTQGTGATANNDYPSVLQQITGLKVVNAGVPGEETSQGLARINETLEKYQPKLVLLCFGGNDLIRKRPDATIKENLKQIIQAIQHAHSEVVLIAVPRPGLWLSVPDFYNELGEELQVPVENSALPKLLGDRDMKSDAIHLNDAGYKQLAQDVSAFLQKQGALSP